MTDNFIARNGHRYSKIEPGSIYELQVTSLVERNIHAIFPDYLGKQLEPLFKTPAGNVKPDIVLIRKDLFGWAVVEVEIDNHGFRTHILPQIAKLTYAEASDSLIMEIHRELLPESRIEDIREAMYKNPKVFLVTHGSSSEFENEIAKLNVENIDVDILLSPNQAHEYLMIVHDNTKNLIDLGLTAERSQNPLTKNCWTISQGLPQIFDSMPEQILVEINGKSSVWALNKTIVGGILRHPADLSGLEAILRARIYYNSENGSLHLEP